MYGGRSSSAYNRMPTSVNGRSAAASRTRFERLVSEAATAALDYLDSGYEVSLITRENTLGFASGARQRLMILETLALIEPQPEAATRLVPRDVETPHLRLAMEPSRTAAKGRTGTPDRGRPPREEVVA